MRGADICVEEMGDGSGSKHSCRLDGTGARRRRSGSRGRVRASWEDDQMLGSFGRLEVEAGDGIGDKQGIPKQGRASDQSLSYRAMTTRLSKL